jgi:hypothetical protein
MSVINILLAIFAMWPFQSGLATGVLILVPIGFSGGPLHLPGPRRLARQTQKKMTLKPFMNWPLDPES